MPRKRLKRLPPPPPQGVPDVHGYPVQHCAREGRDYISRWLLNSQYYVGQLLILINNILFSDGDKEEGLHGTELGAQDNLYSTGLRPYSSPVEVSGGKLTR